MLLWIEGFEGFGTTLNAAPAPTGIVARKFSVFSGENLMKVQTGRLTGRCLQVAAGTYLSPGALTTDATMVVGVACKFVSLAQSVFLAFYDGATLGMNLALTASGEIQIYRGTTLVASTTGLGLTIDTWYYIELKVLCNDTTGTYDVWVANTLVLSASGVDTKAGTNNYHTTFRLTSTVGSISISFDDLYCVDSTGSVNNNRLGDMRVDAIFPTADTASKDWTRSAGNDNYALVDEAQCNDDTDYVESATTGNKDLYDYGALSGVTGSVKGLQINTMCRKTDTNDFTLITVVKSNATESDDAGQSVASTNYLSKHRISETDPNTSSAWTVSGVNAAQFGIKVG